MGPVEIGDELTAFQYVKILGPRHPVPAQATEQRRKTIIGNNVWLSTGSIVLFGVEIGDNAIIGAGSVVTEDVLAGSCVVGNPGGFIHKARESTDTKGEGATEEALTERVAGGRGVSFYNVLAAGYN